MGKIIGIDLGTTNSVVCGHGRQGAQGHRQRRGRRLTPSVVAFETERRTSWSASIARRQAITNPENTVFSVKRFMGKPTTPVEEIKRVPYKVARAPTATRDRDPRQEDTRRPRSRPAC
jgi:molecular chaperone DnaK